jgi:hypothetical protein
VTQSPRGGLAGTGGETLDETEWPDGREPRQRWNGRFQDGGDSVSESGGEPFEPGDQLGGDSETVTEPDRVEFFSGGSEPGGGNSSQGEEPDGGGVPEVTEESSDNSEFGPCVN